ncbi:MAG: YggS family pyridoxal phosphate-dependent enzyme [Synechococcales bacterium]|nr:YggS family pyridoxal phosphate-dependent enzyme [Synechococcales bacterium]
MQSLSSSAIAARIAQIQSTLPPHVRLMAVTKTVSVEAMRVAYAAGIRDFGENRVQEAIAKQAKLQDLTDVTWHLIGHLQRNKAAKAVQHFDWIHSVDSLAIAQRLNDLAAQQQQTPTVCLQVKLLPDPNKYGWQPAELLNDLPQLDTCTHLNIVGLMVIPPYGLAPSEALAVFQRARDLADQIRRQSLTHLQMHHLSMGMSGDYQLAIQAGATIIRLGQIIFGERQT